MAGYCSSSGLHGYIQRRFMKARTASSVGRVLQVLSSALQIREQRRYTGRAEALLLELSSGRESPSIDMRLFVGAVRMGAAKAGLLPEEKQHRVCGPYATAATSA